MRDYSVYSSVCCTKPATVEIITPPAELPIDFDELKTHLGISSAVTFFDAILYQYIDTAIIKIFQATGIVLIETEFAAYYNCFPACMLLKYRPGMAVSQITYIDEEGTLQTLSDSQYKVLDCEFESNVCPVSSWPSCYCNADTTVSVTFTAGYGEDDTDIPADFKVAIYQIVAYLYANRGDCPIDCVNAICMGLATISARSDYRALGGC